MVILHIAICDIRMNKSIFTLEARGNYFLEVYKERFQMSNAQMYAMIRDEFSQLVAEMAKKGIAYSRLRNALTPNINKKEIALVFDSSRIASAWYGYEIFEKVLACFDQKTSHSVLVGDYIGENQHYNVLRENFMAELISDQEIDYRHNDQFYVVYINNLSPTLFAKLATNLKNYTAFIGYFDLTHQTFIKSYLSTILCKIAILHKREVIMPGEADDWAEDGVNVTGLPFEDYHFSVRNIFGIYYDLFLSYKIERVIYDGFETDLEFSLNALSPLIENIDEYKIEIDQAKMDYLLTQKAGKLKKAGVFHYSTDEVAAMVAEKIRSNYIYEMTELPAHNVVKFNLVIELVAQATKEVVRCNVTLACNNEHNILRVVTLF